jgi:hypothetical protein
MTIPPKKSPVVDNTAQKKPAHKKPAQNAAEKKPRSTAAKTAASAKTAVAENEVLRETRAATAHRNNQDKRRAGDNAEKSGAAKLDWKTAAGIGVGSAALIAALLYTNRGKK